jgi:hypothetical protein
MVIYLLFGCQAAEAKYSVINMEANMNMELKEVELEEKGNESKTMPFNLVEACNKSERQMRDFIFFKWLFVQGLVWTLAAYADVLTKKAAAAEADPELFAEDDNLNYLE